MKKLFKIFTLILISALMIGCMSAEKQKSKNNDSIKKQIKAVDENLNYELPLGIKKIKLMESGKVILVVTGKDNKTSEELTVSLNVKDIYIYPFGNGGYRSILFLKENGTVSAINTSELIEHKKIEVMDNLGNLTDITDISKENDQESSLIYAINSAKQKFILDEYIK